MGIISPCYDCEKRCLLCHAHCDNYAKWAEMMKNRAKRSRHDVELDSFAMERHDRVRRTQQERFSERRRGGA